jgi:hypothetical protein
MTNHLGINDAFHTCIATLAYFILIGEATLSTAIADGISIIHHLM